VVFDHILTTLPPKPAAALRRPLSFSTYEEKLLIAMESG
jgi:hypothetical protein